MFNSFKRNGITVTYQDTKQFCRSTYNKDHFEVIVILLGLQYQILNAQMSSILHNHTCSKLWIIYRTLFCILMDDITTRLYCELEGNHLLDDICFPCCTRWTNSFWIVDTDVDHHHCDNSGISSFHAFLSLCIQIPWNHY